MSQIWKKRNIGLLGKLKHALDGFSVAITSDKAAAITFVLVFIISIANILFSPTLFNKGIILVFTVLWFVIEIINTSIETTVDRIGLEYHILSKHAKDLMAAASLFYQLSYYIFIIFSSIHVYRKYMAWKENNEDKSIGDYINYTFFSMDD